jgi:hypothetical protein
MVALRLIRLIETHSEQIARTLATRIRTSPRTSQLQKYRSPSCSADCRNSCCI